MEEAAIRLHCLGSIGRQPFVWEFQFISRFFVIRHSPTVPLFNELFYDEAVGLQFWFEELQRKRRRTGWSQSVERSWYVISNTFGVQLPDSVLSSPPLSFSPDEYLLREEMRRKNLNETNRKFPLCENQKQY